MAAMLGAATLVSHAGRLALCRCRWLSHATTGEVHDLGSTGWRLSYDDFGYGFVHHDSLDSQWAADIFKLQLYADGQGSEWVRILGDDGALEWRDLDGLRREVKRDLKAMLDFGDPRSLSFTCSLFALPKAGARVFAHMFGLYSSLKLSSHGRRPGRWLAHGWLAWEKLIVETCALPASHCQSSVPRATIDHMTGQRTLPLDDDARSLSQKAVSLHAILALLARWSSPKGRSAGGMASPQDLQSCEAALEGLVTMATPSAAPMRMFLSDAVREPPTQPRGLGMWDFCVKDGLADRECFVRVLGGIPEWKPFFAGTCAQGPMVQVSKLMIFSAQSLKTHWLFRQLVWALGSELDKVVRSSLLGAKPDLSMVSEATRIDRDLFRYFTYQVRTFSGQENLSISLDASRVGQKKTYLGIIARPDNRGCVFPPQVGVVSRDVEVH